MMIYANVDLLNYFPLNHKHCTRYCDKAPDIDEQHNGLIYGIEAMHTPYREMKRIKQRKQWHLHLTNWVNKTLNFFAFTCIWMNSENCLEMNTRFFLCLAFALIELKMWMTSFTSEFIHRKFPRTVDATHEIGINAIEEMTNWRIDMIKNRIGCLYSKGNLRRIWNEN